MKKTTILTILTVVVWLCCTAALAFAATIDLPKTGQTVPYDNNVPHRDDGGLQKGVSWPPPPTGTNNTRFLNNSDGTVTDLLTGLMWIMDADYYATSHSFPQPCTQNSSITWQDALNYVNNDIIGYAGYNDWRLPNINELYSLFDWSQTSIQFGSPFVNLCTNDEYWSSTTAVSDPTKAWYSIFGPYVGVNAFPKVGYIPKIGANGRVWPVRGGPPGTVAYPARTWQTTCYDSYGTGINCAMTGQDGEIQAGVTWPSPRFVVNNAAPDNSKTVTDKLTGLMWTRHADLPALPATDPDAVSACSQEYTCSLGCAPSNWQNALNYVQCLNTNGYLGYSDWRLPNINELYSLVDRSNSSPALPGGGYPFANVLTNNWYHWSSTTAAFYTSWAWSVDILGDGKVDAHFKTPGSIT